MCKGHQQLTAGKLELIKAEKGPGHPRIGGDPRNYCPRISEDIVGAKRSRARQRASLDPEARRRENRRKKMLAKALVPKPHKKNKRKKRTN